jgi:urease accessory protein
VPLVLRRTPEAVYLVGGAAGPIGGDRLDLRITVRAGAFLRLRSAAASIALPGLDGLESVLSVSVTIEAGGRLEYLPEPVVIAEGARHATVFTVALAAGASLLLRDELLLGRHGESGGSARSVLRADYAGRPLLRHAVEVSGTDPVSGGPAVLAGHRAYGALLRAGEPGDGAGAAPGPGTASAGLARATARDQGPGHAGGRPAGDDSSQPGDTRRGGGHASERGTGQPVVAVMPLAGPGVLVTALAGDAVTLRRRLDLA